ncbi:hypothetical protein DV515_00009764, partial [Chloebia gouldiae]
MLHLMLMGLPAQFPLEGDRRLFLAWGCPGAPAPRPLLADFDQPAPSTCALRVPFCHTWQKAGGRRWHRDTFRPREGKENTFSRDSSS